MLVQPTYFQKINPKYLSDTLFRVEYKDDTLFYVAYTKQHITLIPNTIYRISEALQHDDRISDVFKIIFFKIGRSDQHTLKKVKKGKKISPNYYMILSNSNLL